MEMSEVQKEFSGLRTSGRIARSVRRVLPAFGLFLAAPLVAEFLLGNMSITKIGMLAILAPLYGGGALLIREMARRAGRGWGTILLLGFAYGVLEEAVLTQSLFNPDYLGLHLHLLDPAYIEAAGIGGWWTVYVLTLHTVWSLAVPIAMVESLVPKRRTTPWLGGVGTAFVALLFLLASFSIASYSIKADALHFVPSRTQFGVSAALIVAVVLGAFALRGRQQDPGSGTVPRPWVTGLGALAAASIFFLISPRSGWLAVVAYGVLFGVTIAAVRIWSHRSGWTHSHTLSLAAGAAMTYAWHAFVQAPSLGDAGLVTRIGNGAFAALAVVVLAAGFRKTRLFDQP